MPRPTILAFMISLATMVLAAPVESESPHQLVPRGRTTVKSSKHTVKLSKTGKIVVGAVVGGLFGLCFTIIGCSMLRTYIKTRRMNKALERKDRIEHEHAKPEDLEAVKQYPGLFETPAHQRLDGWNAQTINGPPPPFASSREGQDEKGVDDGGMFKSAPEQAPPVDSWKQETVVTPSMPAPAYTQASNADLDKDSQRKSVFKFL